MFAMGLIAGIFGILASFFAMFVGGVGEAFALEDASMVSNLSWAALLFSILGIVGASISKNKPKPAGWMMLVAGIGGLISISMAYVLSAILFVIAGIMGIASKKKVAIEEKTI